MAPNDDLLRNLRALMQSSGLNTQTKMGEASGLSQTHIGFILRGAKSPTVSSLEQIAAALGVEVWQLIAPHCPENKGLARLQSAILANLARLPEEDLRLVLRFVQGLAPAPGETPAS